MDAATHPLDRPIWSALTSRHRHLAQGDRLARRYPAEIGPLAGTLDDRPESFQSLATWVAPGAPVGLVLMDGTVPVAPFQVMDLRDLEQMLGPVAPEPCTSRSWITLGPADVPEMVALVELTKPGPFGPRTLELGHYIGLREDGALVAMAGERMRLDGFTEISAVCTHPQHRGRGHARALISALAQAIAARGERSFLHVLSDNRSAIGLYQALGFTLRRNFQFALVRRAR